MINFARKETQLEIFDTKTNAKEPQLNKLTLFFQYLVRYEKAIFSGIAFMVIFLIAYSVGYERGKHINFVTLKKSSDQISTIAIKEKQTNKEILNKNKEKKKSEVTYVTVVKNETLPKTNSLQPAQDKKGSYTIQVVTYLKNSLAKKEALDLKNKGYSPLIMKKGKFVVLCVGNFNDKAIAQNYLKKLKTSYRDCFIKKLS